MKQKNVFAQAEKKVTYCESPKSIFFCSTLIMPPPQPKAQNLLIQTRWGSFVQFTNISQHTATMFLISLNAAWHRLLLSIGYKSLTNLKPQPPQSPLPHVCANFAGEISTLRKKCHLVPSIQTKRNQYILKTRAASLCLRPRNITLLIMSKAKGRRRLSLCARVQLAASCLL